MKTAQRYTRTFENFDEYSLYYKKHEHHEYITDIVEHANSVCADAEYECKSWKTAIKRFFRALASDSRFDGWYDAIQEACENGYFKDKSTVWENGKSVFTGDYFWEVEFIDENRWYICLSVAK